MTAVLETARSFARIVLALTLVLVATAIPGLAQEFPLTIAHKFGTTVIPEKPERVASIDYGGLGNLLALGVQPVTVRDWRPMDGFTYTAGPWAEALLKATPVVLQGDLDFEAIAASDPDVIIALWSGIDVADYEKLSLIAPVVAVPEGVGDYAMSWQDRALVAGRAVGEEAEAQRQLDAIEARFEEIRANYSQWRGKTAVVGGTREGEFNAYTRNDVRGQFMASFGFATPDALDELTDGETFHLRLSPEQIAPYDADVIVWYGGSGGLQNAKDFPARPFLKAHKAGGEIFVPDIVIAALARVSLLSIPVAVDALVPMLDAAADGDPETEIPGALR